MLYMSASVSMYYHTDIMVVNQCVMYDGGTRTLLYILGICWDTRIQFWKIHNTQWHRRTTHAYTRAHTQTRAHMHVWSHMCTHNPRTNTHTRTCAHTFTHRQTHAHVRARTHTYNISCLSSCYDINNVRMRIQRFHVISIRVVCSSDDKTILNTSQIHINCQFERPYIRGMWVTFLPHYPVLCLCWMHVMVTRTVDSRVLSCHIHLLILTVFYKIWPESQRIKNSRL
jgi:hypothetical protein